MPGDDHTAPQDAVDVAIIGAGVVGCAIASAITRPNRSVLILEGGPRIGEGGTSRNSGVIHSGLYYPPGSLKALDCVEGNRRLYEWVAKKDVPHRKTGKLVVAMPSQLSALERLFSNARANGAPGIERVGPDRIRKEEPALDRTSWTQAIWCPETGVVDAYELTRSLLLDAESRGAMLLLRASVQRVEKAAGGWRLTTTRGPVVAEAVVNAAGLAADEVAAMAGITRYRIHPCRGDYYFLRTPIAYRRLIYPVKDPTSPGLGLHLTIDLSGRFRLGPDAEYSERKDDFGEPSQSKAEVFRRAAEALLGPQMREDQLSYDTCGIRPKLRGPDDPAEIDFVVSQDAPGFVNLVGIESPGLTASLALARRVEAML